MGKWKVKADGSRGKYKLSNSDKRAIMAIALTVAGDDMFCRVSAEDIYKVLKKMVIANADRTIPLQRI